MQSSDEASCSDCKLEIIQKAWTDMLLKWLNKCVHPDKEIKILTPTCLSDIMNKYKKDICENDIDRAILCTDDIEPFIKYKYPILRLRYLAEDSDYKKKQYIMTTVLLFHCCIKSQSGVVHADICKEMNKFEQEVILKLCERLDDMEITINNIDCAIKEAFDYVKYVRNISKTMEPSSSDVAQASTDESAKISYANLPSKRKLAQLPSKPSKLPAPSKFNSSVTVLPSVVTDTSTYSDLVTDSETLEHNKYILKDSDEVSVYPVNKRRNIKQKSKEQTAGCERIVKGHIDVEIKQSSKNCGGTCCQRKPYNRDQIEKKPFYDPKIDPIEKRRDSICIDDEKELFNEPEIDPFEKKNNLRNCGGTCCQRKRYPRDSIEKEPFYDPEIDPFEKRRDSISIKEPKYKRYTRKEGFKRTGPLRDMGLIIENINTAEEEEVNNIEKDEIEEFAETKHTVGKEKKVGQHRKDKDIKHEVDGDYHGPHRQGVEEYGDQHHQMDDQEELSSDPRCLENCSCSKCLVTGIWCGDPNNMQKEICEDGSKKPFIIRKLKKCKEAFAKMSKKKKAVIIGAAVLLLVIIILSCVLPFVLLPKKGEPVRYKETGDNLVKFANSRIFQEKHTWICKNNICQKLYYTVTDNTFSSLSRCSLICMGPQLWPHPIGYTYFSNKIVALATNKLEYKFQSIPSEAVQQYLAEAFKLFVGDLARLERIDDKNRKNTTEDLAVKKMTIQIDVETDPEPRLRINTEESYNLKIDTINHKIVIKLSSASFCGVRHGLQTLSQLILLDQSSGKLITLSNAIIKDGPTYRYRGLMIDTARNYIPVVDLMRTIDAMATVKLNTFHWRISDVTSFPLYLPNVPELFEYGAYDRSMIYTKEDVKYLVNRAGVRGIRVIIEVAAPGPVGRAWSWHPEVSCPSKTVNFTCSNVLCLRLQLHDSILDILQTIYAEILEMTKIDDVFHLSDGVFTMANCHYLIEERQGFLDKALERLKWANKGFLPKLPIIWHTPHLFKDFEAKTWEQYGVQLVDMPRDPADALLSKFRVIHSSKWDLSCEMNKNRCTKYRTWQEMYSWKSWGNIEVFSVEGGEAILWTDLVNSGNLDSHIWPRAAAVAERLWSATIANTSAGAPVYTRLDSQRWRMLLNGVKVQPIWPLWCSLNPSKCLEKVR